MMIANHTAAKLQPSLPRALHALTMLTLREVVGSRLLQLSFVIGLVLCGAVLSCSELAVFAHERVLLDGALTAITLVTLLMSIAAAMGVMDRDLKDGPASMVFTHPVSSSTWLAGRFMGLVVTMLAFLASVAAAFAPAMALLPKVAACGFGFAVALIPLECTLALAVAMAARCLGQRTLAWAITWVLVGGGYLTNTPWDLRDRASSKAMPVYRVLQAVVPQMQRLQWRQQAVGNQRGEAMFYSFALLYSAGYSGTVLSLGSLALRRRRSCTKT